MISDNPSSALLERAARKFKALAEPNRLVLLQTLRDREQTVSELVESTGFAQANLSRHLSVLHNAGLVNRRREGNWVHYSVADGEVTELCDVVYRRLRVED